MNKWTDIEDERLVSLWGEHSVEEIVSLMGRHRITVLKKAKELGLREGRSRKWREDEIDYLKDNYLYKNSCKMIASHLKRSERSVYTMADRLGLKVQWEYKRIDKDGYIEVVLDSSVKQREHRYIYEQYLNRKLEPNEHIHHLDENKQNNKLENLIIVSPGQHNRLHAYIQNNDIESLKSFVHEIQAQDKEKYIFWLNTLAM